MIKLESVFYDERARNGTWCTLPYPGHPKGCKNFPQCILKYPDFKKIAQLYNWYAVTEEFNLVKFAKEMKEKHSTWTNRQCRNLLYWQQEVRKKLRQKAYSTISPFSDDIVLEIPEACGVDVFKTMETVGIKLQRNPDYVIKVMLVGSKICQ